MKKSWIILPFLLLASEAYGVCGVFLEPNPRINKNNEVILEYDRDLFPANWRDLIEGGLALAADGWNSCADNGDPHSMDHPILIPDRFPSTEPHSKARAFVPVRYKSGQYTKAEACPDDPLLMCFPYAAAIPTDQGGWVVEIFEKGGPVGSDGNATIPTAVVMQQGLTALLMHELGHVLNLGHDDCAGNSLMHADTGSMLSGYHGSPSTDHCNQLEYMFDPPDPADDVGAIDKNELCRLHGTYCDGNHNLWPKQRSACTWAHVVDIGYYFGRETTERSLEFDCYFGPLGHLGETGAEHLKSPFVALQSPEVLEDGLTVLVSGWVWGRSNSIEDFSIWIDGWPAPVETLEMERPDVGPCQAGFDPEYCDPNSGFLAELKFADPQPGRHVLTVFVTDSHDPPMPTVGTAWFNVPEKRPNEDPVALEDEYWTSGPIGNPQGRTFNVLDNDYDPEGSPVILTESPILTPPSHGTVERLNDYQLLYVPFNNDSGLDSFTYQIEDVHGAKASAQVIVHHLEVIYLP